jgi:hypothetical protein
MEPAMTKSLAALTLTAACTAAVADASAEPVDRRYVERTRRFGNLRVVKVCEVAPY